MKYMGSKNRIAKHILPIMLEGREEGQFWVEPFVGGANMIDKVTGNRIGADFNEHLIKALKLIRDEPDKIPDLITEDCYAYIRSDPNHFLHGFVGFSMSFGGKWFGGYRRDVKNSKGCLNNMINQTRMSKNSAITQSGKLKGVKLVFASYNDLNMPSNCIIYCDPPYENTTGYDAVSSFNHDAFWQWCRDKRKEGHTVYVSEYNAPDDFLCVWEKEVTVNISSRGDRVERLFTLL